jgi:hypothetical protein
MFHALGMNMCMCPMSFEGEWKRKNEIYADTCGPTKPGKVSPVGSDLP